MLIKLSNHSEVMLVNLVTIGTPESQVAAHAFNFSSWEAEADWSEFEATLVYRVSCSKRNPVLLCVWKLS